MPKRLFPSCAAVPALALLLAGALGHAAPEGRGPATEAAWSGEAAPEALVLAYEAYFGGFHIGSARAVVSADGRRYRLEAAGRARGLLDWYAGWRGNVLTRGRLDAEPGTTDAAARRIVPRLHSHAGTWQEDRRWTRLSYGTGGAIADHATSPEDPDEADETTPVPSDSVNDTIDPLTAVLRLSRQIAAGEPCRADLRIYDGRRRYNLRVRDAGTRRFVANSYSVFDGEARGCRLAIERIGGFRKERSEYSETARERRVWVARPLPDALPVPVRVEVETGLGRAVMHLVGAAQGGKRIAVDPGRDVLADN